MDLESIILSEISQRQTAWLHLCIESKNQMNKQKQTHSYRTDGWGGGTKRTLKYLEYLYVRTVPLPYNHKQWWPSFFI